MSQSPDNHPTDDGNRTTHDEDVRLVREAMRHQEYVDEDGYLEPYTVEPDDDSVAALDRILTRHDALMEEHEAATAMVRPRDALLAWSKDKVTLRTEPWEALTAAHDKVERLRGEG